MATCSVTGTIVNCSAVAIAGVTVRFRTTKPVLDASSNLVVPEEVSTTTASNGSWSIALDQGISGILAIDFPASPTSSTARACYTISVPSATSATFASLMPTEV